MFNDELVIDPKTGLYNRSDYSDLNILSTTISNLYKCDNVLITTSGMHSISTIITGLKIQYKSDNINIIYNNDIYWESELIFNELDVNLFKTNDITVEYFKEFIQDQINILFVESCSNPFGNIFDFRIIPELRKLSKKLVVIVDNTWLTSIIFNPFKWDVDCVVLSLTKYYSGGNAIAGGCLFRDKLLYNICKKNNTIMGIHISPINIKIINENIINLEERIIKSSNILIKVIEHIKNNNNIKFIFNPYLENNKSHELSKIFFNKHNSNISYPPILSIIFYDFDKIYETLKNTKILENKTSFGSKYTRIDTWYNSKCCRISIGYDDNLERILEGITEIFDSI